MSSRRPSGRLHREGSGWASPVGPHRWLMTLAGTAVSTRGVEGAVKTRLRALRPARPIAPIRHTRRRRSLRVGWPSGGGPRPEQPATGVVPRDVGQCRGASRAAQSSATGANSPSRSRKSHRRRVSVVVWRIPSRASPRRAAVRSVSVGASVQWGENTWYSQCHAPSERRCQLERTSRRVPRSSTRTGT